MATDFRAQVLQAVDLVQLIGQTVALKRRGKDFLGLCPFHQEKTPSFHVSPGRQTFYCFGCKASGTAFDFVMRRDRVEFKEALEILARSVGLEMPRSGGPQGKPGERQTLLDAHSAACRFFENLLNDPRQGAAARGYLAERSFTDESLKRFQVGLAADAWDALMASPVGRKFGAAALALAGLVKPRQQGDGHYDTFRNRIMFPIRNEGGQIIAFGGRILPGSQDPAKYLNSPETPLFSKSRAIYGLDLARQRIVETRIVAVVEGYTDVIMAHQFGASNVVSVLGTAMTEQHVTVLRRFADRIVLVFDADAAGETAMDRLVQIFLTQPVEIAVASIPDGLDPDEFFLRDGKEGFERLLRDAVDGLEFAWKQMHRRFVAREGDLTGQQKAVEEYLQMLSAARGAGPVDVLRWGAALARVSRLLRVPLEDLHRRFRAARGTAPGRRPKMPEDAATGPTGPQTQPASPNEVTAQERVGRRILGALLIEPHHWSDVQLALSTDDFAGEDVKRLASVLWDHHRDEGQPVLNEFLAGLDDETRKLAMQLAHEVEQLGQIDVVLTDAVDSLLRLRQERQARQEVAGRERLSDESLKELQENARRANLKRVGW